MLRILRVIGENVTEKPATVRLPASLPSPSGYRGAVVLDTSRCLACRMCAYVCVTAAITGLEEGPAYSWTYEAARCTFCARCLERCPGGALSMSAKPLPSYSWVGELGVSCLIPFRACPDCGLPVRPVTEELIRRAFEDVKEDTRELMRRCERCRRRRLQQSLLVASSGNEEDTAP